MKKVTNKILPYIQDPVITSMVQKLNTQVKEQALLEKKLLRANEKLAQVKKVLAEKNQIIDSLEVDLEHVVSQLGRVKPTTHTYSSTPHGQWIGKPVPGLTTAS